ILLRVICSSTPAGRAWPRLAALSMLRSTLCTVSAPATYPLRGSITHPTQPLCTLRGRRRRRLTQHSLPGCLLCITWVGLSPTDRASFAWRLRRVGPGTDSCAAANSIAIQSVRGAGVALLGRLALTVAQDLGIAAEPIHDCGRDEFDTR